MATLLRGPNSRHTVQANRDKAMTVTQHLSELRRRLLWAIAGTAVAAIGLALQWRTLLRGVLFPLIFAREGHLTWEGWRHAWQAPWPTHSPLMTLSPTEPLFTLINLVLAAAVVVSSPLWLYEAWAYLAPVLPARHRRWAGGYLAGGLGLFWLGTAVAFLGIIPVSLKFLLTFSGGLFAEQVRASAYLGFVTSFSLALGVIFALPALLAAAVKLGLLRAEQLQRGRRVALFVSALLAASVVPSPDPFTLLAAMAPIYALYEGTVQFARFIRPIGTFREH